MKSKKTVSIILSVIFFACAAAVMAVCVYICQNSQDILGLLLGSIIFDLIVILELACLAATVVMLLSAFRKAGPVAIALWSAGALFVAVPNIFYFITVLSQSGGTGGEGLLFVILIFVASIITFLTGIFACVFASRLYRAALKAAAQPEITEEAPVVETETEEKVEIATEEQE